MKISPPELIDENVAAAAQGIAVLVIARMIGTKQLDPSTITSKRKFILVLDKLGRTNDYAFDIHMERVPQKINSIRACLQNDDAESAIVLLHTLIESEVNTAIRILLRVRGYTHPSITDALRGADLKLKLDLVLPLLGAESSARIRQLALESQGIRNASVHFKAQPDVVTDLDTREGDHTAIKAKAIDFFRCNSITRIEREIAPFVDIIIAKCPEVKKAHELFQRFIT